MTLEIYLPFNKRILTTISFSIFHQLSMAVAISGYLVGWNGQRISSPINSTKKWNTLNRTLSAQIKELSRNKLQFLPNEISACEKINYLDLGPVPTIQSELLRDSLSDYLAFFTYLENYIIYEPYSRQWNHRFSAWSTGMQIIMWDESIGRGSSSWRNQRRSTVNPWRNCCSYGHELVTQKRHFRKVANWVSCSTK